MYLVNPSHAEDQTDELLDNFRPGCQGIARTILDNAIKLVLRAFGHHPANEYTIEQDKKRRSSSNYVAFIFLCLWKHKIL